MGDAAAKEPSMEDILSSIRKIISEEDTGKPAAGSEPAAQQQSEEQLPEPVAAHSEQAVEDVIETLPEDTTETVVSAEPIAEKPRAQEPAVDQTSTNPEGMSTLAQIAAKVSASESQNTIQSNPAPTLDSVASAVAASAPTVTPEAATEDTVTAVEPVASEPPQAAVEIREPNTVNDSPATPEQAAEEAAFKGALLSPGVDEAVNKSFERLKRSAMDGIEGKTELLLRPMLQEWLDNNLPSLVERLVREEIERVSRGI